MDMMVRIVCVILILVIGIILFDNFKLLIESNEGKKFTKAPKIQMQKPKIEVKSLVGVAEFFFMINHGPDLCKIEEEIANRPYYKGKNYLSILGDTNDKN